MRRHRRRALAAVVTAVAATTLLPQSGSASDSAGVLLPDLDQQTPTSLQVSRTTLDGPARWVLGFQSAVRNVGDGPLLIDGRRATTRDRYMQAQQRIRTADGRQAVIPGVGRLRYAVALGHHHWHYLGFDRYELRRAGGDRALVRDHKSGFCLGDRYRVADAVPAAAPAAPRYTGGCGLYEPQRLSVSEGISVGYGDNYLPYLEGQSLPLSGLRAGRYVLVHRVNADRRLRESDYGNDAASVLLELRWRGGAPTVAVLARCPQTAACDGRAADALKAARVPLVARAVADRQRRTMLCGLPTAL